MGNVELKVTQAAAAESWLEEVGRALRGADPTAFYVLPRVVRRVIKQDRDLTGITFQIPHRKTYVVGAERLEWIVARDELGLEPGDLLPSVAILVARPEEHELPGMSRERLLCEAWRLLFHARVHVALETLHAAGGLTTAHVRQQVDRIGQAEFDEAITVLRRENYLFSNADYVATFIEFAAVYLEFRFFAPEWIAAYFPSLDHVSRVDEMLARDVDAVELFESTRLEGAPDPEAVDAPEPVPRETTEEQPAAPPAPAPRQQPARLMRSAAKAGQVGNSVRAAILYHQAAAAGAASAADAAAGELGRLATRLQNALGIDDAARDQWESVLAPLLERAPRGFWNPERRLLYDLQNVCIDHERETSVVDLFEWFRTAFRRPILRRLPNQREVLVVKHLRSATARLIAVRLPGMERQRLSRLLHDGLHLAEERLRDRLRPKVRQALGDVGLVPQNVPEQVAAGKITEELLDAVAQRGYVNMGVLRDTISRNNLKLADLSSVGEFFFGDQLLQLDGRLAEELDGVYRRGDFYLRWLQRLSSLAFGNPVGRAITRYLIIPFGSAYLILQGIDEVIGHALPHAAEASVHGQPAEAPLHVLNAWTFTALSLFLFGLIHIPPFRQAVWETLKVFYNVARGIMIEIPRMIARLTNLRELFHSWPVTFVRRYLLTPLVFTLLICYGLPALGWSTPFNRGSTLIVFGGLAILLNTRISRDLEELGTEWLQRQWHLVRVHVFVALFELVMESFKRLLEGLERVLYAVDEWLRFKTGDTPITMALKAVLGLVWAVVNFVIRFAVTLLIEPQVNPIKHFPVVTVSHKLLLPLAFTSKPASVPSPFAMTLMLVLPLSIEEANLTALSIIWAIPGIFGFIAWELKENWRLYEANRPPQLKPAIVGSHGETLVRLMKPGFHSGTIPKLYAKLRRAERQTKPAKRIVARARNREKMLHVEESVRHFFAREFLGLLAQSRACGGLAITVERVELMSNSLRVEFPCRELGEQPLWLTFQEQSGWLVAGVLSSGWLMELDGPQRQSVQAALAGLYKIGGVDLVREQIDHCFEPKTISYDISERGLSLWPDGRYELEVVYDVRERPFIRPRPRVHARRFHLPDVAAENLIFRLRGMTWDEWRVVWAAEQAGDALPRWMEGLHLLPDPGRVPLVEG